LSPSALNPGFHAVAAGTGAGYYGFLTVLRGLRQRVAGRH
jgi:hypothetical protein